MISLIPEPLDAAAFEPFGSVIRFESTRSRPVNEGTARRADTAALFDRSDATRPVLAIYRTEPQTLPLRLDLFERHPHSAQSFVALDVARFLVVVAPSGPDGLPATSAARAFLGAAGMGLSYRRNQWHTPLLAIGTGGDLLMLISESGTADSIEHRLGTPLFVHAPALTESSMHGA